MFFKIGVPKNFAIFTRKDLSWCLFLLKLTPKTPKKLQHRCFLVNVAKFLRTSFLRNTSFGCFCCFKKFVHSQESISGGGLIHLCGCNWTRTHNHLASLAKWLSVRLRTKWLWVRVQWQSLKLQISCLLRGRSSLTFRQL